MKTIQQCLEQACLDELASQEGTDELASQEGGNLEMTNQDNMNFGAMFDSELPNASAVMAAICCATSQFAANPSLDLAELVEDLAYTLSAPEYAETPLISQVAEQLLHQWAEIVDAQHAELLNSATPTQHYH